MTNKKKIPPSVSTKSQFFRDIIKAYEETKTVFEDGKLPERYIGCYFIFVNAGIRLTGLKRMK